MVVLEEVQEAEMNSSSSEEEPSDDDSHSSSEESSEEEESEEVNAVFKGVHIPEEERDDSQNQDNKDESRVQGEHATFDLRNLVAMNTHPMERSALYTATTKPEDSIAIPPEQQQLQKTVNEDFLLDKASDTCAQLIHALWQLPIDRSDAGPMVTLPGYDEIRVPRALPPPLPKQETKWEKFAREKGIPTNKAKRSRKVWDDATGTWMYLHGYQKANNDAKEWPIMEAAADDPYADPWEKQRDAKRARVDKNMESRIRNEERAGGVAKGTARRVMKAREKTRAQGREGGRMDRIPTGVPVDLKGQRLRGKESTTAALKNTQVSTASMGKFDKMLESEPERKIKLAGTKKHKYKTATDKGVLASEKDTGMKVLKTVLNGGGVAKEKAIRKGNLATGETAYDYEFDDGLGPGTFRKRKGRAGVGKMKKMTKKRVK